MDTLDAQALILKTTKQKQYNQFLSDLRASGVCNMFASAPYLIAEFPELTRNEAREVILDWMRTFVK